jgi:hypothetical protein
VKRADADENAIGWSQGAMVAGEECDIHLFNPMWKADVNSSGGTPAFGDILTQAANGEVKKASPVDPSEIVVGICLAVVENDEQVLFEPFGCCPDPITT